MSHPIALHGMEAAWLGSGSVGSGVERMAASRIRAMQLWAGLANQITATTTAIRVSAGLR